MGAWGEQARAIEQTPDPEGASLILWMVNEAAEALLFLLFLVMFGGMDYSWVYKYG